MSQVYQKLYLNLNPQQKEAVDTLDGPVMVVAGPGTGKTQILTLRIANILLQEKAKPEEILALTFTESGVSAMRKRLVGILGPKAYYIPIHTFHAFCNEVIQDNPDEFPQFFDKNVLDDIDRLKTIEEVIQKGNFSLLKPFGDKFMYTMPLIRAFSDMKREGISPQKLHDLVLEEQKQFDSIEDLHHEKGPHKGKIKGQYKVWAHNIEKNKEMAIAYTAYQENMSEIGYDYDDMILSVVERLRDDESLRQRLQEKYKYLLADEHQDTNQAQNSVLEILSNYTKSPNIFVVGDEKQSIYRFQGASLSNFLYFKSTYPTAKMITLKENYRSTQKILDASHGLISNNSQKISQFMPNSANSRLIANSQFRDKKVRIYSLSDNDAENFFLARKIKKLLDGGVSAEEIAVLYRDNRDAFSIRDMLEKNKIPIAVLSDEQLLDNQDVNNLFLLLQSIANFGSDEATIRVLHANFLKIPALDIYKLTAVRHGSLHDLLRSVRGMRSLGLSRSIRVNNLYKKIATWNKLAYNKSVPQVFETIVRESGIFDHIVRKDDYIEGITRIRSLHELAKRLASGKKDYTLADFVRHLELVKEKNVSLRIKKMDIKRQAVRLMTAHKAKGLEFDYVFIVGANMGHWGKRRVRQMLKPPNVSGSDPDTLGGKDREDDERRLFYVALTRARKRIFISYPNAREDGRELFPSQFVEEISHEHKALGNSNIYEERLERRPEVFFKRAKDMRFSEDEQDFLREVFEKRGLSPTALNNYLECPWRYFYNNLLQIPRAKTKHEMYGTAVHEALKDFFNAQYTGQTRVSAEHLFERFEHALDREPISQHDFDESLQKGRETLEKYYDYYSNAWHADTVNEFAVKNVFLDGEVRLVGKIDKIEITGGSDPPVDRNEVNVVDYKTGKRKTRNALLGQTKNSKGNEFRQLVFYKLLLDKMPDSPYKMVSGEIDFVEPEKRTGKLYKEKFFITEDHVRDLEYKIQDVVAEILGFAFWDRRCDNKDCEYCRLRNLMKN